MFEYDDRIDPVEQSRKIGKAFAQARHEAEKRGIKAFLFHASSSDEFDARSEMHEVSDHLDEIASKYLNEVSDGRTKLAKSLKKEFEVEASKKDKKKEKKEKDEDDDKDEKEEKDDKDDDDDDDDDDDKKKKFPWDKKKKSSSKEAQYNPIADVLNAVNPLPVPQPLATPPVAAAEVTPSYEVGTTTTDALTDITTTDTKPIKDNKGRQNKGPNRNNKPNNSGKRANVADHAVVGPSNPLQTQTMGVQTMGLQTQDYIAGSNEIPVGMSPHGALRDAIQLQNSAQTPQAGSPLGALGGNIQTQTRGASILPEWIENSFDKVAYEHQPSQLLQHKDEDGNIKVEHDPGTDYVGGYRELNTDDECPWASGDMDDTCTSDSLYGTHSDTCPLSDKNPHSSKNLDATEGYLLGKQEPYAF